MTRVTLFVMLLMVAAPHMSAAQEVRWSFRSSLSGEAQRELDSAIVIVRRSALWRDTVTWRVVEGEVRAMAAGATTAAQTYSAIRHLLVRLGDRHSFLVEPDRVTELLIGGPQNAPPQVRMPAPGIGYISVPGYFGADTSTANPYARSVHEALASTMQEAGTCRWVVDLRANTGGNMYPMLAALRPFLGDTVLGAFVAPTGVRTAWKAGDEIDVRPPATLASLASAHVAVLTSGQTASSGEAVTISFIGRPRTRSFGSPTAGLSTGNEIFFLPDGAMMLLTTSVEEDRTGKRYGGRIVPDEVMLSADSAATVDDPTLDRAIAWLRTRSCT